MKKTAILILVTLFCFAAQAVYAAGESTVISVSGKAWHKASKSGEWQPLKAGDKLAKDSWVKTDAKSAVRMVKAGGGFVRISAKKEQQLSALKRKKRSGKKGRFFGVMNEMFSGKKRARMAASRGAADNGDNSQAMKKRESDFYNTQWEELMRKPRLEKGDMDMVFETAGYYQERQYQNRAVALLVKLNENSGGDEALAGLAGEARKELGQPAAIKVFKKVGSKVQQAKSGVELREGNGVQVRYRSETESYFYLYLHTIKGSGGVDTARIYPPMEGPGWALAADKEVELPLKDEFFLLDDTPGSEFMWGWACTGPLLNQQVEKAAVDKVLAGINQTKAIDPAKVEAAAPSLCTQGFTFDFKHL